MLDVGDRLRAQEIVSNEVEVSLVVCDMRLGDDQGREVVQSLKALGCYAPILYITGYASQGSQGLKQNEHLLVKPFLSEDLKHAIHHVLNP